jgi:hypothetical protein
LILGGASIQAELALPWTPGLIVAAYGGVLLYSEMACGVTHAEMTNNSPYFLGFIFFLFSLLTTFRNFSSHGADAQFDYIVRQLGTALLPTIVGLPLRQLLFAHGPSQADQDLFFRTLEDELRRGASEFRRSQAELVQLVQQFVEMRKGLFSEEEKAARDYVHTLERAIGMFQESLANYPSVISTALSACAQSVHALKEKLRELNQAAQQTEPNQLSNMIAQFESVKASAGTLAGELSELRKTVEQLRLLAGAVPGTIKEQLASVKVDVDQVRSELIVKVATIQSDLTAIDKVLSDFVAVAQVRIEAMR